MAAIFGQFPANFRFSGALVAGVAAVLGLGRLIPCFYPCTCSGPPVLAPPRLVLALPSLESTLALCAAASAFRTPFLESPLARTPRPPRSVGDSLSLALSISPVPSPLSMSRLYLGVLPPQLRCWPALLTAILDSADSPSAVWNSPMVQKTNS